MKYVSDAKLERFAGGLMTRIRALIPTDNATAQTAGLMSAADKAALDALVEWKDGLEDADQTDFAGGEESGGTGGGGYQEGGEN